MTEPTLLNVERAKRENDNTLLSPLESMRDAANMIEDGTVKADAAFMIFLDRGDDPADPKFGLRWFASNIWASEMLALLECAKVEILKSMNYLGENDAD